MLGFAPLGAAPLGALALRPDAGGLLDTVSISDTVEVEVGGFLAPDFTVRVSDTLDVLRGLVADSSDQIMLADAADQQGVVRMVERLVLGDAIRPNQVLNMLLRDRARITDDFRSIFPLDIAELIELVDEQAIQTVISMTERLRLRDTFVVRATYGLTILQSIRLRSSLARFFSADVDELWGIVDEPVARLQAMVPLKEQLKIGAVVSPQLLLAVKVRDTVEIKARDVVRMIFEPRLVDGFEITAGYIGPDGSFTTWAMNTRTAAVTEYSDFAFNSFARLGNRYLGASPDGLFELVGDTDAGGDIIARIRSGYMQFGGPRLSRLKEAYIAARGEGEVLLRIITADGETYTYAASTRNMRSTKVHMGKGQRSRYFAFELVTAGQDFDLDTIEFVPIVMQRRV